MRLAVTIITIASLLATAVQAQAPQAGTAEIDTCAGFRPLWERGELTGHHMSMGTVPDDPVLVDQTRYLLFCTFYDENTPWLSVYQSSDPAVLTVGVASESHAANLGVSATYLALTGVSIGTATMTALSGVDNLTPNWSILYEVDAPTARMEFDERSFRFDLDPPPQSPIVSVGMWMTVHPAAGGAVISTRDPHLAVVTQDIIVNGSTGNRLSVGRNRVEVRYRVDQAVLAEDLRTSIRIEAQNVLGRQRGIYGRTMTIRPAPTLLLDGRTRAPEGPALNTWETIPADFPILIERSNVERNLNLALRAIGPDFASGALTFQIDDCPQPAPNRIRLQTGESCILNIRHTPIEPGELAPGANRLILTGGLQGPVTIPLTGTVRGIRRIRVKPYGTPNDEEGILYFGDIAPGTSTTRRIDLVNESHSSVGPVSVQIATEDPDSDFWIVGGPRIVDIAPGDTYPFRVGYTANRRADSDVVLIHDPDRADLPRELQFVTFVDVVALTKEIELRLLVYVPQGRNTLPLDIDCIRGDRTGHEFDGSPNVLSLRAVSKTSLGSIDSSALSQSGWRTGPCLGSPGAFRTVQFDDDCATIEGRRINREEARYQIAVDCPAAGPRLPAIKFDAVVVFSNEGRDVRLGGGHSRYPSFELWVDDLFPNSDPELLYSHLASPFDVANASQTVRFEIPQGSGLGPVRGIEVGPLPRRNSPLITVE